MRGDKVWCQTFREFVVREDDLLLAKVMIGFALIGLLLALAPIFYTLWRLYA